MKTLSKKFVALSLRLGTLSLGLSLLSCQSRDWDRAGFRDTAQRGVSDQAESTWETLWTTESGVSDIQPVCRPIRERASAAVPFQGHAILLHGFSACPQQYEELAPMLARAGFDVYVPLYPGHGVVPTKRSPREDVTDRVPKSPALWNSFVGDINLIAAGLSGGKKVLIGLSHGANLALRAMQFEPELYDRAVLIAPKLKTEASQFTGLFTNGISLFNIDNFIAEKKSGWKKCEEDANREPVGRGGFCSMENRKAIAMLDFAKEVIASAPVRGAQKGPDATVQAILSVDDDGVANDTAMKVFADMKASGQRLSICKMPPGIPHSMFSKYDFPYEKPWVDELFTGVLGYVESETPYPGSSASGGTCISAFGEQSP